MEVDNSYKGLQIHDLLLECANHAREVGDVSEEIISFAKSDAAPDAPVLSDLLLDTLFLYDSGVSCEDEDTLAAQRGHLGQLISKLIAGQCIVEQDAYERLDAPLLYAAGLIPDAKAFEKKHVRINTNLLYKQQKFNLFREDNEGYSKLVVELEAFLQTTKNAADDDRAQLLLTNIKSLIGYFDLDPNRVLDVLIELVALHLLSHWRFLIPALKLSPWFLNDGQIAKGEDTSRGDLDKRYGNRAAAQIIGFKFQQVKNLEDESQELTMLAALLVKEGLLKLQDLWPHLSPEDSILSKEKSAYQDRVLDQVDKAKGRNALAMSGGLDDEDSPSASMTQAQAMEIDEIKPTRKDNQQKIALLYALLNIGALPEALFVLSEFSFLLSSHPHLAEAYDKLLEHMIEPLWTQLRPQQKYPDDVKNNLQQLKRIPEELKYRDSALILPLPAKTVYVLDPRCNTRDAHLHEIFFYDQIDSQLTFCDNYATFEAQVLPLIRLAGVQIHRNVKLFAKIAKLGKSAILASADPEGTRQVWQAVLRSSMIPALSLLDTNPAIVNDIFNLISEYSTEQRYSMYGEWFTDSYKKIPELKVQFVKTEKETKSLLRRISKTNTKEYGRRLAKTSHSNPCIVLNIALNQIESYDNLVDVVIEASRYFTLLTFDVLVFVMLTLLSNTQKRRLKEDGTSVAHWLQSLSSFTAKIFRRYSHMDPSPIAVYVAKQLKMNNAFDLIILRDLINEMAGLRPTSDLSEEQLQGCAGGPYLRIEALLLINERRDPSAKAPMRLLHALDKAKLSFALPILIGQQRTQCVYNVPEEQSLLKLLANLADEVHQILIQYLEFLTLNTTVEHYTNSIPSISELVHTNGLEPCVAFMIARPAISAALQDHFKNIAPKNEQSPSFRESDESLPATKEAQDSDMNKSVTNEENVPETAMDVTSTDAMQIDPPIGVDVSKSLSYSLPLILTTLSGSIETFLPASVWSCMSSALYTTFWSFSLYDLVVPSERYEKEISKIKVELDQIKGDEANAQIHKVQLKQLTALQEEHVAQKHNARMVTTMFELEHSNWLGKSSKNDETALDRRNSGSVQAFLQHCLLPRCLISPNDATYCAEFLVKLQNVQMQGLDLMLLYASLFGPHLATSIFCCTEREAENLGRFLGKALERLNEMTTDEAAFNSLHPRPEPDVLQDNEKASSKDTSPWSRYKTLWYDSFHRGIWSSIKACFESREYMHIRNTMIVLERMQNAFPLFKWIGKNIEKEVDKIISTERREDLKIRALGYKAVLKRQQPKWLDPPGKPTVQKSSTAIESQQSQELPTVKSPPVISSSAASDDAKTVGPAPQAASNPEVASLDPILSAQTLETRVPERTGADMTSSSISLEQQKEKAKQKAASLSQHLKEQAQTAVRVKTENDNSQKGADKPDAREEHTTNRKVEVVNGKIAQERTTMEAIPMNGKLYPEIRAQGYLRTETCEMKPCPRQGEATMRGLYSCPMMNTVALAKHCAAPMQKIMAACRLIDMPMKIGGEQSEVKTRVHHMMHRGQSVLLHTMYPRDLAQIR
ncbi:protein of unknown function [Taphrina deformans PYCC 5710]|uniref:THO complex subunit 2 n=1 Tax=Taphrina deformans (strain PYCC 5710 / ATCC 11124 / CBS 356.35 / IMI 108563 / JCM 9778 / NBRC 8474) TaxID=1097556 RepID=R4XG86_TAPDE|nr:protein of unknown function [Taphrina deformans PYCC 5710]|eukprot:CCG84765.1 protein of unknown function [Taphrina deformans PYCC 5710]